VSTDFAVFRFIFFPRVSFSTIPVAWTLLLFQFRCAGFWSCDLLPVERSPISDPHDFFSGWHCCFSFFSVTPLGLSASVVCVIVVFLFAEFHFNRHFWLQML
jgi:hypothetical protein